MAGASFLNSLSSFSNFRLSAGVSDFGSALMVLSKSLRSKRRSSKSSCSKRFLFAHAARTCRRCCSYQRNQTDGRTASSVSSGKSVRFRLAILLHLFFLAFQFVAQINCRQVCQRAERRTELSGGRGSCRAEFPANREVGRSAGREKTAANGDW